jgi:lipopolysaccharide export system protein LptA
MKLSFVSVGIALLFFSPLNAAKSAVVKTVITGDQMEIIKSGQTVIFTGNSKVVRGDSVLTADKITQDKVNNRVDAEGKVNFKTITRDKEPVSGKAGKITYRPEDGLGEFSSGRPEIWYYVKDTTSPVHLLADTITFDQKKEEIYANGTVEILTSSACAYAPSAVFMQKDKKVLLTGQKQQPRLVYLGEGNPGNYQADKITMFVNQKKVLLEGNVHGIVKVREKDANRVTKQ